MLEEEPASSSSPSLISNLRHYRFNKQELPKIKPVAPKATTSTETSLTTTTMPPTLVIPATPPTPVDDSLVAVQPRKKVRRLNLSDDDEDQPDPSSHEKDIPISSTLVENHSKDSGGTEHQSDEDAEIEAKEAKVQFLLEAFPNIDKMVLQDQLMRVDWQVEAASEILATAARATNGQHSKSSRDTKQKKKKVRKRRLSNDDSSDGDQGFTKKTVFDSSDSEPELDDPTTDQLAVLEFLQTATAGELLAATSQKKAGLVVQLRPFNSWRELVVKLQQCKGLSTDLLTSAQEFLNSRRIVTQLMTRCVKLSARVEAAAGAKHVVSQPKCLNPDLKLATYQLVGLNWLITMHREEVNGILADEMGLGKTVQVIALLAHLHETGYEREGPHLIVVPSSTLDNWHNELERWCPSLRVTMFHGSQEDRRAMRVNWCRNGMDDTDVILSTYNIVGSSPDDRKLFRVFRLDYVILDEAHMLKNMATQRYENLMRINAKRRVLLTGTPLQNTLLELMSLLIFVMPHMFSKSRDYLKDLFQGTHVSVTDGTTEVPRFERTQVAQARRIMRPFVLRRLKSEVLRDLPVKTDETLTLAMSEEQASKYRQLLDSYSRESQEIEQETKGMTMMMQLRKLANHPVLLRYHYKSSQLARMATLLSTDPLYKPANSKPARIREDLDAMSDFELHQTAASFKSLGSSFRLPQSVLLDSGKFAHLDRELPALKAAGHRVLVFSQFVIMLDVLQEYLEIRNYRYLRIDGQTAVHERQELIDEFTADQGILVFLLSTRAGGLGINLTAADTVIIHDIDFNPYNDKQAEDRCHRLGQTRPVRVMRLISKDTIEEGMRQVAQEKLHLEREITTEDGPAETKSIVSLLKKALGVDGKAVSPTKQVKPTQDSKTDHNLNSP